MRMREITVGDVPVRALRVTFVGELGWELYCPTEYGAGLWRTLWEAGQPHGLRAVRLPGDRLAAAGEGLPRVGGRHHPRRDAATRPGSASACADDKAFIGSDALGPSRARRLRCLMLEDPRSVALGNEPVRVGGEIVRPGDERRLRLHGRALDRLRLPAGRGRGSATGVEIDIFGRWVGGDVVAEPLFDPEGTRVRGSLAGSAPTLPLPSRLPPLPPPG